jgi:arylsulfatase A
MRDMMNNLTRRELIGKLGACALGMSLGVPWLAAAAKQAALGANATTSPSASARPNIILLLNDDHGWGDMSCAEHPVLKTPALDRIAAEGVRFTNFYASAPICSPARAGLFTGRIQNRFGMDHLINIDDPAIPPFHHIPPQEPTLAKQLRHAGYRTCHIGKWHLSFIGRPGEPSFNDYGFDEALLLGADRKTGYFNSHWTRHTGERFVARDRWSAEVYVDEAIAFIERTHAQPFFLNLWSFTPHAEVNCPPEYRARFAGRTEAEQYYFGAITQMDDQYARLLKYLDEHGLADNTWVIFSSDNGCEPPVLPWTGRSRGRAPLRGSKHNLGDAGLRVPGLMRWPGVIKPGSVVHTPVSSLDLLPTFSAAAGVTLPGEFPFDGGDLRPAFAGTPVQRAHALYWQCKAVSLMDQYGIENVRTLPLAVRDGCWKLYCTLDFDHLELYNLDTDPSEKWNMAEIYPEIAQRLLTQLRKIYQEVNGPYSHEADVFNPRLLDKHPGRKAGRASAPATTAGAKAT